MPTPRLKLEIGTGTNGTPSTPPKTNGWGSVLINKYGPYAAGYWAGKTGSVTEADALAKGGDYLIGYHAGVKDSGATTDTGTQPTDITRLADLYEKLFGQTVQLPSSGQGDVQLIPQQSTSSSFAPYLLLIGGAGVIIYFIFFRKKKTEQKGGE